MLKSVFAKSAGYAAGLSLAVSAFAAGPALAGATEWFDRDNPGGDGDYELATDLLTIQCRIKGGGPMPNAPGYTCSLHNPAGAICVNARTVPANSCQDLEVRFGYRNGTKFTPWFDRDNPGGDGDFETVGDILNVACQTAAGGPMPTGPGYRCAILNTNGNAMGAVCQNKDTRPAGSCVDLRVRFGWQ